MDFSPVNNISPVIPPPLPKKSMFWPIFLGAVGLVFVGTITLVFIADKNEFVDNKIKTTNDRFFDNGDGSILDTSTQTTWLKCDIGARGDNCELSKGEFFNMKYAFNSAATVNESADWVCLNGVLCKDKTFQIANTSDNDGWPKSDFLDRGYPADEKAKEIACISHGGVAKANWGLPILETLATLYDASAPKGINEKYFPNSSTQLLAYGTPTNDIQDLSGDPVGRNVSLSTNRTGVVGWDFEKNQEISTTTVLGLSLKCVSTEQKNMPIISQSKSSGDIFCQPTLPYKTYSENVQTFNAGPIPDHVYTTKMKLWTKVDTDGNSSFYSESLMSDGFIEKGWDIENLKNSVARHYYYIDGRCHYSIDKIDTSDRHVSVKNDELTGENKLINGYMAYKLKKPWDLSPNQYVNITLDYINKEFCEPMEERIDMTTESVVNEKSIITITKLEYKDFSDSIIMPPSNCQLESNE